MYKIECKCGLILELTDVQFAEFDCGMMGMFDCPECHNRMLPHAEKQEVTIREHWAPGEPTWL